MTAGGDHVESIDAFRGLAVASMILVNNPGSWVHVYEPLVHSGWNGCTFADLIFPAFIFIVGLAMPFAFARRAQHGVARRELYRRIGRRAVILIGLGLILNLAAAAPAIGDLRIPGVLQRIGVVYFVAAVIGLNTRPAVRGAIAIGLLLVQWTLLAHASPSGLDWLADPHAANLGVRLDTRVFGRHLLTPAGDPEGLLGTLTAVSTALLGTLAGDWLRSPAWARLETAAGLALGGAVTLGAGLAWATLLPLNKALWTGSFVLVTAGVAALTFAVCYLLIDIAGLRRWAQPFVWLGVNPLAIYFLSELAGQLLERPWLPAARGGTLKAWLYWSALEPRLEPRAGEAATSLVFALVVVGVWLAVAGLLRSRRLRIIA